VLIFKQTVLRLLVFCGMLTLLWSAWLIWQNDSIADSIRKQQFVIDSSKSLKSLPPFVTEPLRQTLYDASIRVGDNNEFMTQVANEYIKRRPLDAQGWLWASLFYQRSGDFKSASQYLSIAHQLSFKNTPQLSNVFNRYLEMGLIEQALPVARDLSFAQPAQFRKTFYLMTRLNNDYQEVVDQVIPRTVPKVRPGRAEYKPYLYYNWAMNDAVRAKNSSLAKVVWGAIPRELKSNSSYGSVYVNYLIRLQDFEALKPVWRDHTGDELIQGVLPKQIFDSDQFDEPLCWRIIPIKNESATMSSLPALEDDGLRLEFAGEDNVHYFHTTCTFAVESNRDYSLSGRWMGDDITTLSGPYVEIYAPAVKGFSKRIKPMIGSWPWSDFELNFKVPEGVELLTIRIRRNKTSYLDSKIAGHVSFKNFKLTLSNSFNDVGRKQ